MKSIHDMSAAELVELLLENHAGSLADYLCELPDVPAAVGGQVWEHEHDCGTVRFRIAVSFEPTGLSRAEVEAGIAAEDEREVPAVREAARRLLRAAS